MGLHRCDFFSDLDCFFRPLNSRHLGRRLFSPPHDFFPLVISNVVLTEAKRARGCPFLLLGPLSPGTVLFWDRFSRMKCASLEQPLLSKDHRYLPKACLGTYSRVTLDTILARPLALPPWAHQVPPMVYTGWPRLIPSATLFGSSLGYPMKRGSQQDLKNKSGINLNTQDKEKRVCVFGCGRGVFGCWVFRAGCAGTAPARPKALHQATQGPTPLS